MAGDDQSSERRKVWDDVGFDAADLMREPEFHAGDRLGYAGRTPQSTIASARAAMIVAYLTLLWPIFAAVGSAIQSMIQLPDAVLTALGMSYMILPLIAGVFIAIGRRGPDGQRSSKHAKRVVIASPLSLGFYAIVDGAPFLGTVLAVMVLAGLFLLFVHLADVFVN